MNYADMPDAELNRRCARDVMGYSRGEGTRWYSPDGNLGQEWDLPDFCNSPDACFGQGGVVAEIIQRPEILAFAIFYEWGESAFVCRIGTDPIFTSEHEAIDVNPCRAIVIAALKAVEA